MQFVFCILFFKQIDAFEKVFSKCFNKFDVHSFIISNIRPLRGGRQLVNTQNYVFYFESDIAKIYPFRPTCSFFDSERKTKSKGELKRTRKESEQIWQTWINSMGGFFVIFIWNYHYSTQLICTKGMN